MMFEKQAKAGLPNLPLRLLLCLSVLLSAALTPAVAQDGHQKVTGTVVSSSDNLPLPGVNVIVKGTTNGTITNVDGQYQLNADTGDINTDTALNTSPARC